jgi:hypothetical protein
LRKLPEENSELLGHRLRMNVVLLSQTLSYRLNYCGNAG